MTTKPKVEVQGKVVVERNHTRFDTIAWTPDKGLMMMFPDGQLEWARSPLAAVRKANAWFRDHANADAINVGTIEWRDGLQPPSKK